MVESAQHYTLYMIEDYSCSLQFNKGNNIKYVDITCFFIPFRIFISSITGNKVLNFNIFQQFLFMTPSIQLQQGAAPRPRPPPRRYS